ncbi:uncharacterized protein TNCV_2685721 [Trichonephila clavipes]|nr:uncharacterized protein TNCV_2685721 [Trichonephila clavipes]
MCPNLGDRILETIHDIHHSTLKIYTDGSVSDGGISRSGTHIETPNGRFGIKIRNNNCSSVFMPELAAIYKGLQFIDTASELAFEDIWILTDSSASIQHLSHWTTVRDMTSLNMMDFGV